MTSFKSGIYAAHSREFIPDGHWLCYPRKVKRRKRIQWQTVADIPPRKAKGWRRHVRKAKAMK